MGLANVIYETYTRSHPNSHVPNKYILQSHRTSGRISENIYSFTADANDNKARFRCEASNIMSQTPLKAEVDLTVMCKYLIIVFWLGFCFCLICVCVWKLYK